jgi:hypothetical protein
MKTNNTANEPRAGIYYLIPNPKTCTYELFCDFEEKGEDVLHLFLWESVVRKLERMFKKSTVAIVDAYRGIPRGRILPPHKSGEAWIVAHGNDVSLKKHKEEIIAAFGLEDAFESGKVLFLHVGHEQMLSIDKAVVQKALGIRIGRAGFTKDKQAGIKSPEKQAKKKKQ